MITYHVFFQVTMTNLKQALQQVTVKRYLKSVKRKSCPRHRFAWNEVKADDQVLDDMISHPINVNFPPEATIFAQVANQVMKVDSQVLRFPSQAWKVKLVGEGADDAGGVFDDTMSEMCKEVIDPRMKLLMPTPNAKDEVGLHR